jgi:hypothetical protein
MRTRYSGALHETWLFVIRELDEILRNWPPPSELNDWRWLAHEATKNLDPLERYATILAGPTGWRHTRANFDCTVEGLDKRLQEILEQRLTADLHRVVGQWVTWDVRKLRERREEALAAKSRADADADAEARRARRSVQPPGQAGAPAPRKRRIPPPPTFDQRRTIGRATGFYQPPPKDLWPDR